MDRLRWASLGLIVLAVTTGATCNRKHDDGPAASVSATATATPVEVVELPGVDSSALTDREKRLWSEAVGELLAPCAEVAVPVSQCVTEKRDCASCLPADVYRHLGLDVDRRDLEKHERCLSGTEH